MGRIHEFVAPRKEDSLDQANQVSSTKPGCLLKTIGPTDGSHLCSWKNDKEDGELLPRHTSKYYQSQYSTNKHSLLSDWLGS